MTGNHAIVGKWRDTFVHYVVCSCGLRAGAYCYASATVSLQNKHKRDDHDDE